MEKQQEITELSLKEAGELLDRCFERGLNAFVKKDTDGHVYLRSTNDHEYLQKLRKKKRRQKEDPPH